MLELWSLYALSSTAPLASAARLMQAPEERGSRRDDLRAYGQYPYRPTRTNAHATSQPPRQRLVHTIRSQRVGRGNFGSPSWIPSHLSPLSKQSYYPLPLL